MKHDERRAKARRRRGLPGVWMVGAIIGGVVGVLLLLFLIISALMGRL